LLGIERNGRLPNLHDLGPLWHEWGDTKPESVGLNGHVFLWYSNKENQVPVLDQYFPERSTVGIAAEFTTVNAWLKCKKGRIVPNLKMDHSFDVDIPVNGRMANVSTIPSVLEC
jgi:hypothetical protein